MQCESCFVPLGTTLAIAGGRGRHVSEHTPEDPGRRAAGDQLVHSHQPGDILCPGEHEKAPGDIAGIDLRADASLPLPRFDEIDEGIEDPELPRTHLPAETPLPAGGDELEQADG